MSTTRKVLRQEIARRLHDYRVSTATGGSTTTLIDTALQETDDDFWNLSYLWIPTRGSLVDMELKVTDYTGSSKTLTFNQYSTLTVINGTEYELWAKWRPSDVNMAINASIRDAWPSWFTETTDDSLIICTDTLEYTLPTMRELLDVSIELCDNSVSGTATGGTAGVLTGTLIDTSQSWTTNAYVGWHLAVYDGTAKGHYLVITGNTDTTLRGNVDSDYGGNWDVAPDTTSKYILKDFTNRTNDFRKISAFRTDKKTNPTKLYLTTTYTDGMYLRLHYLTEPSELNADTSTTDIDSEWIVRQSLAHLFLLRCNDAPLDNINIYSQMAAMHQGSADQYKITHGMRWPQRTFNKEYEFGGFSYPEDYPF